MMPPLEYNIYDSPEYKELSMKVDTNIKFEDVILSNENKEKFNQFILEMDAREKLEAYGLKPMNRILMYGDSGTGKTFSSKALSNRLGYNMFYVDIAKALSEGRVTSSISKIFEISNKLGNSIVFFDECDGVAWARDRVSADGDSARIATNSLFQNIDQMNPGNIIIAATNMFHRLDVAFIRRFDMKMEFRKPAGGIENDIIKFLYTDKGFKFIRDMEDVDRANMSKRLEGQLSYYEIQIAVERAMKDAVLNNTLDVKETSIYNIFSSMKQWKNRFNG